MTPAQNRTVAKLADSAGILHDAVSGLKRVVEDTAEKIELEKAIVHLDEAKEILEELME
jgi:hypothetical protein